MNEQPLQKFDPQTAEAMSLEKKRQNEFIELIPSENFVSPAVLQALGSVLTNKYAEGLPGKRYYGGCEHVDQVETLAIERAKELFQAEHANVQPLSGAPANLAAYFALLEPNDTVLGMDLSHGGHLTHGHPVTAMAKIFNFIRYKTAPDGFLDYNNLREMALEYKPKLILTGYSAYSRDIDYEKVKRIADEIGALTMADIAHTAGLIAAGQMNNPVPLFDVVTSTTHKTLRGPRGGLILCKEKWATKIDKAVFPGLQGGPHMNNIAGKAVAFKEAMEQEFKEYGAQIIANARSMADKFIALGYEPAFGGTDNHLLLINLNNKNISGNQAQEILDKVGITCNKNMVPDDPRKAMDPSGIRLGTPAMTTRGFKQTEFIETVGLIDRTLNAGNNQAELNDIKQEVLKLTARFPLYKE